MAFLYQYRDAHSIASVDINRVPEPSFPEAQMNDLMKSANDKTNAWLMEKIFNDEQQSPDDEGSRND
jgi:hypothetical protein